MSDVWYVQCDGCGVRRLPENTTKWKKVQTWDDGSTTLHYCERCQERRPR